MIELIEIYHFFLAIGFDLQFNIFYFISKYVRFSQDSIMTIKVYISSQIIILLFSSLFSPTFHHENCFKSPSVIFFKLIFLIFEIILRLGAILNQKWISQRFFQVLKNFFDSSFTLMIFLNLLWRVFLENFQ
jgi:hypothetical protein